MGILIGMVITMLLLAALCVVAGIYLLVGLAWTLVASGLILFAAAIFLRAGMTAHG